MSSAKNSFFLQLSIFVWYKMCLTSTKNIKSGRALLNYLVFVIIIIIYEVQDQVVIALIKVLA